MENSLFHGLDKTLWKHSAEQRAKPEALRGARSDSGLSLKIPSPCRVEAEGLGLLA
jgi:hypothetical protein